MRVKAIVDIFKPFSTEVANEDVVRMSETFIISSLIAILTMVAFSIVTYLEKNFVVVTINSTTAILIFINLLIYKKFNLYSLACNILYCTAVILLFCHQVMAVEPYPHNYFWGCLIPVFAAMMSGKKSSLIWALVVAIMFSVSYLYAISEHTNQYGIYIAPDAYRIHFLVGLNLSIIGGFVIANFVVRELDDKRKKIDKASYRNQILLNIVTHDVSNPLTVLQTALNMFNVEQLDEKQKKNIARMIRSVEYLGDVIKNVRQTNAIHSGKFEVEISKVNLTTVIEKAVFLFEEKLASKQLNLKLPTVSNVFVYADPVALGQSVLNNLLSNAIKFSHHSGEILIDIKKIDDFVLFSVTDRGVGMSPSDAERVFLPYTSTTKRGTDNEEGTGFGMPIVKALIERFGGEVFIESTVGLGTKVTIKLKAV